MPARRQRVADWLSEPSFQQVLVRAQGQVKEWEAANVDRLAFLNERVRDAEVCQTVLIPPMTDRMVSEIARSEAGAVVNQLPDGEREAFKDALWGEIRGYASGDWRLVSLYLGDSAGARMTGAEVSFLADRGDLVVDPSSGKLIQKTLPGSGNWNERNIGEFIGRYGHLLNISEE